MCGEETRNEIDKELRNVKIPPGLLARVKRMTEPTDWELDLAIRSLEVPAGITTRVKSVIADTALDESLREITIPPDLLARLRIIPQTRVPSHLRRLALVASLLLVITGSFFGTLGGLLASIRPLPPAVTSLPVIDVRPTQLVAAPLESIYLSADSASSLFDTTTIPVVWAEGPPRVELSRIDPAIISGPAEELISNIEDGLQLGSNIMLLRWNAYASPQQASQRLPELEQIRREPHAGVGLPVVAGYDRSFLLRTATHPPIFVAAHEQLRTIRVPLSTSIASLRRTEHLVDLGRLPEPQEVRTEDFLAAINYGLPSLDDDVSMTLAAGPAYFSAEKHSMLQVGVKAARRVGDLATHLSVVIDVSQSMRQQRRLEVLRNALQTLFTHLSPDDSISIVAVNHEVTQQVEFATSAQQDKLETLLRTLRVGGGDRLSIGMEAALTFALEVPREDEVRRQLVVVTDGAARWDKDERERCDELLQVAKSSDIQTTMIQFGDRDSEPLRLSDFDTEFDWVAPEELPWALVELASGVSSIVASQLEVSVSFNSKAVRAYRLVGHGPSAMTGLIDETSGIELRSGQEATLLFEVWTHDSYEDEVVSAEVKWKKNDADSTTQRQRESISRYEFPMRWDFASARIQAAVIAAEIGERLRGDRSFQLRTGTGFREQRKSADWLDIIAAAKVNPHLDEIEGLQRLIELIQKLDEMERHHRSTTKS